jgi:hypothetical protein
MMIVIAILRTIAVVPVVAQQIQHLIALYQAVLTVNLTV